MIQQTKKRVLLVSHNSNLSGAPISLSHIAHKLPLFGFSPLLILPKHGPLEELLKSKGIEYKILKRNNDMIDFVRIIKKERPMLVHVNSLVKTWPIIISRLLKRPVVWHVHEFLNKKKGYARLIHCLADRVILGSHEQYDLFAKMPKAILSPYGIDHTIFKNVQTINILPENCDAQTIITYIGTIEPRKGLLILAKAAALLSDRPWIHFIVVGEAPERQEKYKNTVLNFILNKNLDKHFHFLGRRSDIPEILASSTILCHPAFIEVFGIVVIEAMASKLPVIGTQVGEMPRIIANGRTGFVVPPGDHHALAKAIIRLDANKKLCEKMGQAGFIKSVQKFEITQQTQKIARMYQELLHSKQ